ncbi:MAG TPA: DUF2993 domain-containing protein [Synergistetes bacterium]|nr:DUF2993 domain-containing protein [Synergistota bacterium]
MRSSRFMIAVFLTILFAVLPVYAEAPKEFKGDVKWTTSGERLFAALVERLNPDSMEMSLDEEPKEDGSVRHMYVLVKGARFGAFRLEEMALETRFSKFNPVSEWVDAESIRVEEILSGNFAARVLESDINAALKEQIDEDWQSVRVEIRPEGIFARGYYVVRGSISLKILVELSTGLEVRSKKVWLKDYSLFVNNAEKTSIVEQAVRDLQPVVDLDDFVFPLNIDSLDLSGRSVQLTTRTAPKPFEGIRYVYSR